MQVQARKPSMNKLVAAAAAVLAAAALVTQHGSPRAAAAAPEVLPTMSAQGSTMHAGIDWDKVPAAPVSTGATVGAYD
jgi:hypothetical protein